MNWFRLLGRSAEEITKIELKDDDYVILTIKPETSIYSLNNKEIKKVIKISNLKLDQEQDDYDSEPIPIVQYRQLYREWESVALDWDSTKGKDCVKHPDLFWAIL